MTALAEQMIHDFRSPYSVIRTFVRALEKVHLPPELCECLAVATSSTERIDRMLGEYDCKNYYPEKPGT